MPHDADELRRLYDERTPLLRALAVRLTEVVTEALAETPHIDRVGFRHKDAGSFVRKAMKPDPLDGSRRKYTQPFSDLEDQVGGRAITFFLSDIPVVRERMEELFGSVEHVRKEPAGPAQFGYESDHLIFVIAEHHKPNGWNDIDEMPSTFEFQIRTLFMHAWAEPQHDINYKSADDLDVETQREIAWIAASAWGADRTLNDVASRLSGTDESPS